jgi:hypothetical protein
MEALTAADPRAVGEYRLRGRLGTGGMGLVFLAASPAGRMVAIKVIRPELARDPKFIRRFRREMDAAQRVCGMYTAPVVAAGIDDVPPWLATAFVPGPSLDDVITMHGPLPVPALWRLAGGLAEALRAIHSTGLIHRDLKPGNVLLAPDGPRVIDFGIARAITDTRMTATGSVVGTPSFMSPEQVEQRPIGPASDMFSFGSVLTLAASGASPFSAASGGSPASAMYRIVHGEPDLARVAGGIRELIAACLAKDPARRPDPGQVATYCATAAEPEEKLTTTFWPAGVARVITAHQAALSEQLQALQADAAFPASTPASTDNSITALSPGLEPAAPGLAAPGSAIPGAATSPGASGPFPQRGASRRELLTGADGVSGNETWTTVASYTAIPPVDSGIVRADSVSGIDPTRPNTARVYDYFLGGKDNFEADRIAAEAGIEAFPKTAESARAARAFLRRVVQFLTAEAGIRQFLDIGTGLPSGENVHQVAQSLAPDARIVYVDNDPIVLLYAQALLKGNPGAVAYLNADLRCPGKILGDAAKTLDFSQPVGLLLLGILHNVGDEYDPYGIVRRLVQAIPAGSYLAVCHLTADIYPELADFAKALNERQLNAPLVLRDHAQVTSFFEGLDLVEPGVIQLSKWRPQTELESSAAAALWGGVARKPA